MAEIIQRVRPDVLLINEFDFDAEGLAAELFQRQLPRRSARTAPGRSSYRYRYVAPSNTGIPSGFDLDNNGTVGGPQRRLRLRRSSRASSAWSSTPSYPIDSRPGPHLPELPLEGHAGRAAARRPGHPGPGRLVLARGARRSSGCRPRATGTFRSTSAARSIHFLVSHPTPPVFDGPEDRNGTRNHDEIRFWADYIRPSPQRLPLRRRRPARRPRARASVRDRRRPERRPARRRQRRRRGPAAARQPAGQRPRHPDQPGRARAGRAPGRRQPHPPGRPRLRHRRLPDVPGPATCAPTTCCRSTNLRILDGARVLAAVQRPAVPAGRRVPVPDAPTTAWSGSMWACIDTARPPLVRQRLLLGWAAVGRSDWRRGGR